jgi:hypothetical protein
MAEVSTHFPPELLSRKSLPISDFFLRWYKQELYNINCQSDEESRSFNLFKNAIRLLQCLEKLHLYGYIMPCRIVVALATDDNIEQ